MNRRDFVATVETFGIACVVPGLLAGCASVRYAKSSVESDRLVVLRTDLAASGTVLVETPDEQLPILLRRVSDTEFVALSTKCTHRGCQVENAGTQLSCPCHGSVFSLTGERLQGPADRPLTRFAVSADDRSIFISRRAVNG
ncbi:MAG: Rieske (2Fe-2S) protein [Phycisphaerae bacterium]|nr:Rieske (2Fe-2S) protein [Gemmatimonadaceae bacterium]